MKLVQLVSQFLWRRIVRARVEVLDMKLEIIGLLICGLVAVYSDPQFYYDNLNFPWPNSYFRRDDNVAAERAPSGEGRLFFATQYFTIATKTVTSTITSSTSCTTSTAPLAFCVPSGFGRRRRSAARDTSLFYKESEFDNIEATFLPSASK